MLDRLLPFLRCPGCEARGLLMQRANSLSCVCCSAVYPFDNGILDMFGGGAAEKITPFQRLMQSSLIVSIYEKVWRRIGYYLASSRAFEKEVHTVIRLQEGRGGGLMLDLACGTGVFTRPLAHQVSGLVVGFDLSQPMLRRASRLLLASGLANVLLVRGTVFRLPFADGAFSYINCCGALHLFADSDKALREIERVLDPRGYLCIQTTIRPLRSWGFSYFLERFIRFGFFDEGELHRMLQSRGFRILETERHRISYTLLAQHNNQNSN